jgi:hypothetical protein
MQIYVANKEKNYQMKGNIREWDKAVVVTILRSKKTCIERDKYYLEEVSKTMKNLRQDIWSLDREIRAAIFCGIKLGVT